MFFCFSFLQLDASSSAARGAETLPAAPVQVTCTHTQKQSRSITPTLVKNRFDLIRNQYLIYSFPAFPTCPHLSSPVLTCPHLSSSVPTSFQVLSKGAREEEDDERESDVSEGQLVTVSAASYSDDSEISEEIIEGPYRLWDSPTVDYCV